MHRSKSFVAIVLGCLVLTGVAMPRSALALPPTSPPVSSSTPSSAAPSAPQALPAPLIQDDEMLQPVAAALRLVSSWDEALGALRARSTDLRIALDEVERSDAVWRETLAASLPTLNGSANLTGNLLRKRQCPGQGLTCLVVPNALTYGASVTLTQPLLASRAWHAARTAKLATDVALLSAADQKRLLTIALADAVVSVVTSERISEINRVGLRAALDRLQLARRRQALGAANALDTVRADQDVSVARSAVGTADEALRPSPAGPGLAPGA